MGVTLDCPTNSTPKSKHKLREKFEDACLDKPISTYLVLGVGRGAIVPKSWGRPRTDQLDLQVTNEEDLE